jgi:hypothetical protein
VPCCSFLLCSASQQLCPSAVHAATGCFERPIGRSREFHLRTTEAFGSRVRAVVKRSSIAAVREDQAGGGAGDEQVRSRRPRGRSTRAQSRRRLQKELHRTQRRTMRMTSGPGRSIAAGGRCPVPAALAWDVDLHSGRGSGSGR